jgi:hypothetical protein
LYFILNKKDEEFIPRNFLPENGKLLLIESEIRKHQKSIFEDLHPGGNAKSLFILFNSIGIKKDDITKAFDLLSIDDRAVVIGKSGNSRIAFIGSNTGNESDIFTLLSGNYQYEKLLNILSKEDIFLHSIENFLSVDSFNDVKKLYIKLSKKDSLSFCSEIMHERFNDLFVEYKELLDE